VRIPSAILLSDKAGFFFFNILSPKDHNRKTDLVLRQCLMISKTLSLMSLVTHKIVLLRY